MKTLNNDIQESHCSFELCMLLKEKSFDVKCFERYFVYPPNKTFRSDYNITEHEIYRPSHALAIEWIRINFGIWICIDKSEDFQWWKYNLRRLYKKGFKHVGFEGQFNSPQEATETALKYVLEKLIK